MSKIKHKPVPDFAVPVFRQAGIRFKKYTSTASYERDIKKFIKRNQVLHLCTCKQSRPRATPLGYNADGFTVYVLSEGGGKFDNLKKNRNVSFSIAEPYEVKKDFFGDKGLQAWGKAKVYSIRKDPDQFSQALKRMNIKRGTRKLEPGDLPQAFHYRIIEIIPDRIRYRNAREGIFNVTWERT